MRVLEIDLSERTAVKQKRETAFLGGRGANYELLWDTDLATTDPLDGPMAWASGLLVGTGIPGASRVHIAARSPITHGIGSSSAGTDFAACLRASGFDQLLLTGACQKPVYILITSGGAVVKDAAGIWGLTTSAADRWLRQAESSDARIATIGPAGERGVSAAAIIFDGHRAAGRCGMGAVMGHKRVKAIVVVPECQHADAPPRPLVQAIQTLTAMIEASPLLAGIRAHGTTYIAPGVVEPVRNFQHGRLTAVQREGLRISSRSGLTSVAYGCSGCPVRCGRSYSCGRSIAGYPVATPALHANSITDFGSRLGIYDMDVIVAAHGLCTDMGLDIDNASCAVAWAFEAQQRGLLESYLGAGKNAGWGSGPSALGLLENIALKRGLGGLLAAGTDAASREISACGVDWSVTIKGQSLQEAVRPFKGWALGIMVSERGGTHTRGAPVLELRGHVPSGIANRAGLTCDDLPSSTYEGKAAVVTYTERLHAVLDSLGLCYFVSDWMGPELAGFDALSCALRGATGSSTTSAELAWHGERIHVLGRLLNSRLAGFNRADDRPPPRMRVPLEEGECLGTEDWEELLDEYYRAHDWDTHTGLPPSRTLRMLDMEMFGEAPESAHEEGWKE